jgi:hypothetical protein
MKKLFFATLVALAGLAVASCTEDPVNEGGEGGGKTVAPVLSQIQGAVLDVKGADITTTYTAADFGQKVTINYALFVDKAGNKMANKSQVNAVIADGNISMTQANLSLAIMALGVEVGEEVEVEFALYAYVGSTITSSALVSEYVKATFTTCAATIDADTLPKIWVIGNFNGWSFDNVEANKDYIYDFEGNGTYSGLVYYAAKAITGWKLAIPGGTAGAYTWDDHANWGFPEAGAAAEDEALTATLECAGGSKDMKAWAHNFYFWYFTPETLELKMATADNWDGNATPFAFDQMYLVGSFNGWTTFDPEHIMKYIPTKHTFYADVTLADGDEVKFIADGQLSNDWYIAWGEDCAWEGGNIKVETGGNYRVYFDFNNMKYEFDASMYGKDEEGGIDVAERDVNRPDTYHIYGDVLGSDWSSAAADLERDGETSVYKLIGLAYNAGEQFKVVKNDKEAWYGVANGEYKGSLFTLTGTDNFQFDKDGGLDICFDAETQKVEIFDSAIQGWAVIGNIGDDSWSVDYAMTKNGDVWTSEALDIKYDGSTTWGCKIRKYGSWTLNYGVDETLAAGTAMPAVAGGGNINYNGKAKIVFNEKDLTITVVAQ